MPKVNRKTAYFCSGNSALPFVNIEGMGFGKNIFSFAKSEKGRPTPTSRSILFWENESPRRKRLSKKNKGKSVFADFPFYLKSLKISLRD
jgi:hypothetical protein